MKYINVEYIEEVCGGLKEIIVDMVDIFITQVPEFQQEMDQLLAEGKYLELGLLAHKAKSSVAIMGMEDLANKLKKLEINAKTEPDLRLLQEYVDSFKEQTDKALVELDEYIKNK